MPLPIISPDSFSGSERAKEAIASFNPGDLALISSDPQMRWMGASQMQKAIRRNHPELAMRWAASLFAMGPKEKAYCLYRLAVIACEDVAPADPARAARFLEGEIRKTWLDERGALQTALFFCSAFAQGPKNRSSCDLATALEHPSKQPENLKAVSLGRKDPDSLVALASDASGGVFERTLAFWLLAGHAKSPTLAIPSDSPGDWAKFLKANELTLPPGEEDTLLCVKAFSKICKEPHAIALALARTGVLAGPGLAAPDLSNDPIEGAWLLCAIDGHTREGREAMSSVRKSDAGLRKVFQSAPHLPWNEQLRFLSSLAFRAEGGMVSPELQSAWNPEIESMFWRCMSSRFAVPDAKPFAAALASAMPQVQEARARIAKNAQSAQTALATNSGSISDSFKP